MTDTAWAVVRLVLPPTPKLCGRLWRDYRTVIINGIFWVLATGVPWRNAPKRSTGK